MYFIWILLLLFLVVVVVVVVVVVEYIKNIEYKQCCIAKYIYLITIIAISFWGNLPPVSV